MNKSEIQKIPKHLRHEVELSGCWRYLGGPFNTPYGHLTLNGKLMTAHRFYYLHYKGEIGEGNQVDHLCMNKRCVNPDHLDAVSPRENVRRAHRATHCYDCKCAAIKGADATKKPRNITPVEWLKTNYQVNALGCWNWLGPKNQSGIGMMHFPQVKTSGSMSVARASYLYFKGDIPTGLDVIKNCKNTFCYNPDHLFVGTQTEASQSAWSRIHCGGCRCETL
jgi:hypothetical protein